MPAKKATKKTTAKKPTKRTTRTVAKPKKGRKIKEGQTYECGICGFRFVVDDCGCVEEHYLICCSESMTQKRAKKTTKRTAGKAKKTTKKTAKKVTKKKA
jgi:hypothetical protein